jgi:hypothetical protein
MIKQRPRQNEERPIAETTYSRGIAYQGWGEKKRNKKTNKKNRTHLIRKFASYSYSSHHHQTMHKTTSEPKKKAVQQKKKKTP